jgi:hypothetical protein
MNEKNWVQIKTGAEEDSPSVKKVMISGLSAIRGLSLDATRRESTQVLYELSGAWKGTFTVAKSRYDTISVPRAGAVSEEGLPEIPQEGIFVAVPKGATNVKVKAVQKKMQVVPGTWKLKPAPKPIIEEEYLAGKEEYKSKPEVYNSDNDYPGKDFEFLGLKSIEGVPVVHLIIYLAQYKAKSGKLSMVKSMTIEVSYDVPPQMDAIPRVQAISPALSDMILDFENVYGSAIDQDNERNLPIDINRQVMGIDEIGAEGLTYGFTEMPSSTTDAVAVLKRNGIVSEYVIITPNALKTAVQPLLNAKSGWPHYAMIATTQTISAEFVAKNLKESIRAFLSWAWDNWTCPPRFVVLAGDVDVIPTHTYTEYGAKPISDHYYADIRGDRSPEIVVSRIPTSDATKMQQICQNLAQYANKRGPDWGSWQNKVALVAYEADTYKQCSNEIATAIAPRFNVTKLYGDSSTRQQVIDRMNTGVVIANYRGHGSKTEWSSSNGLRTAEIRALNNGNMPPMVISICCQNAWIDDQATEAVVETFLREGKCVAVLGASRNSPTYANNDFDKYLWQAVMDGEVTPGGIVQRAKALMVQNHGNSTTHQEDVVMYMLCGDPTAKVVSTVEFLRGTWDMDHDGWKGILVIDRIWQSRVERIGSCGYPVWSFSGTYAGQDVKQYTMQGKIGGRDPDDANPGCKRSDHKVTFIIAFPNNNQRFDGYVTTWTRNIMAGYTWWSNRPFAWYSKKR